MIHCAISFFFLKYLPTQTSGKMNTYHSYLGQGISPIFFFFTIL